jgi:hypothetical protein|tara:strand:+ start:2059 stop:2439 length:381 start_codon:yes stop_codon:yes gene_type:complete
MRASEWWHKLFIEHPRSTVNPQGYWGHFLFGAVNSIRGLWYMFVGIIHGFVPYLFPFSTSSFIIRSFKKLVESRRHRDELQQILDFEFIRQLDEELLAKKKKKRHYLHPDLAELARLNNAKKDPEQ